MPESDLGRGILIAFEGLDGAGKTTQVNLLAEALRAVGEDVVVTKEPTNATKWGKRIRESAASGRLGFIAELCAFIRDRRHHVRFTIQPALDAGKIVILDRYFYSTIAYQGARWGKDDILRLDRVVRRPPVPDMVFVLDIDPATALTRIAVSRGEAPNHFERAETLTSVRRVFDVLCAIDDRLWKLDGNASQQAIHAEIVSLLIDGVLKRKRCAEAGGCDDPVHCGPRLAGTCEWARLRAALRSRLGGLGDAPAGVLLARPPAPVQA